VLFGDSAALKVEYMRWLAYWARQSAAEKLPDNVLDALRTTHDSGTYPMLSTPMTIFATLPVTTATGEQSFSSLKFIKNYLRSTMGEERLNGLAHLFINLDIKLDCQSVIEEFGRYNRRLAFKRHHTDENCLIGA
jgi:hAT family C-terminal dimerisation region